MSISTWNLACKYVFLFGWGGFSAVCFFRRPLNKAACGHVKEIHITAIHVS